MHGGNHLFTDDPRYSNIRIETNKRNLIDAGFVLAYRVRIHVFPALVRGVLHGEKVHNAGNPLG